MNEFTYRDNKAVTIWYVLLAIPVIILKDIFDQYVPFLRMHGYLSGASFILELVWGTVFTLVIVLCVWKVFLDHMPGVHRKGCYWVEDGIVCMQLDKRSFRCDNVEELFIKDRELLSGGIRLLVKKSDKEKIWILSEYVSADKDISDTVFASIFKLVLAGNPSLAQEKDAFGKPLEYFYKK